MFIFAKKIIDCLITEELTHENKFKNQNIKAYQRE